jgi:arginase
MGIGRLLGAQLRMPLAHLARRLRAGWRSGTRDARFGARASPQIARLPLTSHPEPRCPAPAATTWPLHARRRPGDWVSTAGADGCAGGGEPQPPGEALALKIADGKKLALFCRHRGGAGPARWLDETQREALRPWRGAASPHRAATRWERAGGVPPRRQRRPTSGNAPRSPPRCDTIRGAMTTVSLIGAPTDVGASVRGAGMGPDALRVAGLAEALRAQRFEVIDRGNLAGPPNPWHPPAHGIRHLQEVVAWNRAVFEAVATSLALDQVPLLMGGDHCLAIGSISAVARQCRQERKNLRVIWLDAHTDVNTEAISPQRQHPWHARVVPAGARAGRPGGLERRTRGIHADGVDFIGIRSVDADEKEAIRLLGLQVFDMRHIDEHGMRNTMTEVLQDVDEDTHIHVSFDLDCLDPLEARASAPACAAARPTARCSCAWR